LYAKNITISCDLRKLLMMNSSKFFWVQDTN